MSDSKKINSLVKRSLEGNFNAFGEIVDMYEETIMRIVGAMVHYQNDIEDLVQETFIKVYEQLSSFDEDRCFEYWIKAIARNIVKNSFKKNHRYSKYLALYREHILARYPMNENDENNLEDERMSLLKKCKEKLSDNAVKALDMRYKENMSVEDIAVDLGRKFEATKKMMTRSKVSLKECMSLNGAL